MKTRIVIAVLFLSLHTAAAFAQEAAPEPKVLAGEAPAAAPAMPVRPRAPEAQSNATGTYGEVILDGDSAYFNVSGAVMRATTTSRPYVVAQTGTATSGSAFAVYSTSPNTALLWVAGHGNVGIGTTAPSSKFQVFTATSSGFPLSVKDLPTGLGSGVLLEMGGNSALKVGSLELGLLGAGMIKSTTGMTRMMNDVSIENGSTARFNVASVNPTLTLQVGSDQGFYPAIYLRNEAEGNIGTIGAYKPSGGNMGHLAIKTGVNQKLAIQVNDNATDAMVVMPSGAVGIGVVPDSGKLFQVGGNAHFNGTVTGTSIVATYQDVAEWVPTVDTLAPGTVVVLDGRHSNHVLASSQPYDPSVAGVVSAQPGLALGVPGADKALIATTGRVRVRVDATKHPIAIGDLLVTSGESGTAMKSEPIALGTRSIHQPGTIIGKALEPLTSGKGDILVLLSLQ